jgi:hypothetical protein
MEKTKFIYRSFYDACPQLTSALALHCKDQGYQDVLDIGPGCAPFPAATRGVGRDCTAPDLPITVHDLLTEIPEGMVQADFVYCRHVVEDLYNPVPLLEALKKCQTGYVETPSPVAELALGIDANNTGLVWQGYRHHHWICWAVNGKPPLYLIPKYVWTSNLFSPVFYLLLENAIYWNTGLFWENNEFDYKILLNEVDFEVLRNDHLDVLQTAISANVNSQQLLYQRFCPPTSDPWRDHDYSQQFNAVTFATPNEDLQAVQELAVEYGRDLDHQPVFVEIGVWAGNTTRHAVFAGCKVFAVDTWEGSPTDYSGVDAQRFGGDNILRAFCKNMRENLLRNVFPLRGSSRFWSGVWPQDLPIDIVYIDADHEYESVKADIEYWTPLVRSGGIIAGHDYNFFPGVNRAVEESGPFELVGKHVWWRRKE